jgi:hypothetical protein
MKTATAYVRNSLLYLHSCSKTSAGVWIATDPFVRIENGAAREEKGEVAVRVLEASRDGAPHPTNWSGLIAPLLGLAKVKSWKVFMKGAACLNLELEDNKGRVLRVIPCRNLGPEDGFEPIQTQAIDLLFPASLDRIGAALESAIPHCQ